MKLTNLFSINNKEKKTINNDSNFKFSIAPMMDRTDTHFRNFMRLITKKTLLYTEMINVNSIIYGDQNKFLAESNTGNPLALQIGISDTKLIPKLTKKLINTTFSEININCGCPSNRVVNGKFGAILMKNPDLVGNIVYSLKNNTELPITVKTRIGVDNYDSEEFLYKFVEKCINNGVNKIIIHARKAILKGLTPHENRTIPPLNYMRVKKIKKTFHKHKIVINGGIMSIEKGKSLLDTFDGVMIGRAAWDNPWMFSVIDDQKISKIDILDKYLLYVANKLDHGFSKTLLLKPIFNLFYGVNGSKMWKQQLSNYPAKYTTLQNLYNLAEKIENSKFDGHKLLA